MEGFGKYRNRLLVAALIISALLLYSAHLRSRDRTSLFERSVLWVTAPLLEQLDRVWEGVAYAWDHYLWLVGTAAENDRLRAANARLAGQLADLDEIRLANERLRELLGFKSLVDLPTLPAQVIAEDATSWFRTVVIDKGSDAGVVEGMPVVVAQGAVGRVIRVSAGHARVLLITDASSAVASLVQDSRTRGVCRGRGDTLTFDFALRREPVAVGDRIVSSGTGGVFPKGIVVGTVSKVARQEYGLFQEIEVTPSVDFARLEEVLVLLLERP